MFSYLLKKESLFENLSDLFIKFVVSEDLMANQLKDSGVVLSIADGIAMVIGLSQVKSGELIVFNNKTQGMALNLEKKVVRAVIFGSDSMISQGDYVIRTFTILEVPVGE
jgi:F-type H+-transporting ATPase subunit alpha